MTDTKALESFISTQFGKDTDELLIKKTLCACKVVRIKKKEILFMEGEAGNAMYFLAEGLLKLYKVSFDGKESVIHFVSAGEIFAEIVLNPDTSYPVTSVALEDCVAVAVNVNNFFDIMHKDPVFMQRYFASMSKRLKNMVHMLHSITSKDAAERFLSYLSHISEETGSRCVTLTVPKKDLALLLGTTPETLSRLIKRLTEDGVIAADGQNITLLG